VGGCGCITLPFEEQDGEVVTEVGSGHVPAHLVEQGVERLFGCPYGELRGDVEEGEELPVPVARFAEPVGVEQEPVTGLPCDGRLLEVIADAEGEPCGYVEVRGLPTAGDEDGGRVSAAGQRDRGGAELDQERGGEVFGAEELGQIAVHPGRNIGQLRVRSGCLPERADDPGRLLNSSDALSFHVPDDETNVAFEAHVVEVTADRRVFRGGQVARRCMSVLDRMGKRRKDRLLCCLGDRGDPGELMLAPHPHVGDPDRCCADQADIQEDQPLPRGAPGAVPPAGPRHQHDGCRGERRGGGGWQDGARDQGRQAEKGVGDHARRYDDVHDRPQHKPHDGGIRPAPACAIPSHGHSGYALVVPGETHVSR
jgi:hypothetical protein